MPSPQEEEIDLIGEGRDFSIFAEFKWRNRDFDRAEVEKLIKKSQLTPAKKNTCVLSHHHEAGIFRGGQGAVCRESEDPCLLLQSGFLAGRCPQRRR